MLDSRRVALTLYRSLLRATTSLQRTHRVVRVFAAHNSTPATLEWGQGGFVTPAHVMLARMLTGKSTTPTTTAPTAIAGEGTAASPSEGQQELKQGVIFFPAAI